MTDIPQDIADQLGELTENHLATAQRLLQAVGADRTRELLAAAITRLAATRSDPQAPANAPKTVRGMLFQLLEGDALDLRTRTQVFDRPYRDPVLAQQITALADRLGETDQAPRTKIRQLVQALGYDMVAAVTAEAERIEAGGGLLVPDGSRRRTLGGALSFVPRPSFGALHLVFCASDILTTSEV